MRQFPHAALGRIATLRSRGPEREEGHDLLASYPFVLHTVTEAKTHRLYVA